MTPPTPTALAAVSPRRVQMRRDRPWQDRDNPAVVVARPTMWGNPYTIAMMQKHIDRLTVDTDLDTTSLNPRALAVEAFRADLTQGPDSAWWWFGPHTAMIRMKAELQKGALAGRDLACWCPLDELCHGDVLLEIAIGGVA